MNRLATLLFGIFLSVSFIFADADEINHIRNGATPPGGLVTLALKEQWRAGGLDEDVIFGVIVDAATDKQGNVYILDNQLCQVTVFSPQGEHLGNLSRQGEGPGEIQQPIGLVLLPEQTLGIVMGFPGKIIKLTTDGVPAGTLYPVGDPAAGGFGVLRGAEYASDKLVACGSSLSFNPGDGTGSNTSFLTVDDLACQNPQRFLEKTSAMQLAARKYVEADEYYVENRWAVSSQGRIYAAANRDRYEISVYDLTGKQIALIEREYKPRKRTEAEKDLVGSDMHVVVNGEELQFDRFVEDYDPSITRLETHDDDSIWVLPPQGSRDQPAGILETWDVFDLEGNFTRQIAIPLVEDVHSGVSFFLGADRLLIVKGADADNPDADVEAGDGLDAEPIEVICYQIQGPQ